MSHKDMCIDWVDDHTFEDDDGKWWCQSEQDDEPIAGPFNTESALQDYLWDQVLNMSWADYGIR